MADRPGLIHLRARVAGVRLRSILPDGDILFGDVEMAQLIVRYTAFSDAADREAAHFLRLHLAALIEQLPLLDRALLVVDEVVEPAGAKAVIHTGAVDGERRDLARRDIL